MDMIKQPRLLPLFGLAVAAMVVLSVFGRNIQIYLYRQLDPVFIPFLVFGLFAAFLSYIFLKKSFSLIRRRIWVAVVFLLIGLILLLNKILMPAEIVHFLLFFCLGFICVKTFGSKSGLIVVIFLATGDEVLQHYLPQRVGDILDVIINVISGCVGWYTGSSKSD